MQFESSKISSYYNSSSKPSFFMYRAFIIVSMVVLLAVLGVNLYSLDKATSTTSKAANPGSENIPLPSLAPGCEYQKTPQGQIVVCSTLTLEPTSTVTQSLPPLPPQCKYEAGYQTEPGQASPSSNVIKCTEGGKSCTYTLVDNHYVMTCDR